MKSQLFEVRFVVDDSKDGSGKWQKVHTKYPMASQTECWGGDSLILSTLYGIGTMLVAWTPYWTPHNGAFRDNTQRSKKQKLTCPPIMVPQIIVKAFFKMGQRGGDPGQDAVSIDRESQKEDIEKSFPKTVTEESR